MSPQEKAKIKNAILLLESNDEAEGNSEDVDAALAILQELVGGK